MESEERRKNKKIAATESVRTRIGTVISMPFCCVGDVISAIWFWFCCRVLLRCFFPQLIVCRSAAWIELSTGR